MTSQLVRPTNDRRIGGVAAALANRYGWDVSTVRIAMVASILLPGPQVLGYLVGWAVIPDEASIGSPPPPPTVTGPVG